MKRCVKSSHFPPSEKWALKEAKNNSTAISDGALLCLYRAAEDDLNVLVGVHLDAFHHLTNDAVIEFMQQIVAQIPREHEGAIGIAHILAQKAFLIMELFFAIAESSVSLLCDMI